MAHRKWKEAKQLPGTAGPGNRLSSCFVSFHFLWAILCPQALFQDYVAALKCSVLPRDAPCRCIQPQPSPKISLEYITLILLYMYYWGWSHPVYKRTINPIWPIYSAHFTTNEPTGGGGQSRWPSITDCALSLSLSPSLSLCGSGA